MLHRKLIALHTALGCEPSPGGVCALYEEKAIDAWLDGANEFKAFQAYNAAIAKGDKDIPALLGQANLKRNAKNENDAKAQALSADESLACEIEKYVRQGDQYSQPNYYFKVFGKSLSQTQALHISRFAHPMPQNKERRLLFKTLSLYESSSFIRRIFKKDELTCLVEHLNSFAKNATANFAMSLASDNHGVSLGYDVVTKKWELMDITQPDCPPISSDDNARHLAAWILKAFQDENANFTGFSTKVYCRADHYAKLKPLAAKLEADESFKKLHEVTVERAKRVNARGWSLPIFLARHGNLRGLASIVDLKSNPHMHAVDLNLSGQVRGTSAYMAAQNGHAKALRVLVEAKDEKGQYRVDLNKAEKSGQTPVWAAAQNGHDGVVRVLAEAKDENGQLRVDLNKARDGATPAYMAAQNGYDKALRVLVEAKDGKGQFRVNLNKARNNGVTPVYIAAQKGHAKALEILATAKNADGTARVNLNQRFNDWSPAHVAAWNDHVSVLKILAENGADLELKDKNGKTARDFATDNNHRKAVNFFKAWDIRCQLIREVLEAYRDKVQGRHVVARLIKDFHENHECFLNKEFLQAQRNKLQRLSDMHKNSRGMFESAVLDKTSHHLPNKQINLSDAKAVLFAKDVVSNAESKRSFPQERVRFAHAAR